MLKYEFMRNAFMVSAAISVLCPCIGIFLVLKRFSMIGDTLAHASLAGITLGLVSGVNPVVGAFVFTAACGALIEFLRAYFKKNADLIMSIVLAVCVGTAITIISSGKLRMSADSFMFGSILTVSHNDLAAVIILSAVSVLTLAILFHKLVYITYDEEAAEVAGVRSRLVNYIFMVLAAAAASMSIRIVGVLVLSSIMTLPVATALQLERGFRATLAFSVVFSVIDVMSGLILSYYIGVAPGGFTALVSVAVLALVIAGKQIVKSVRVYRGAH